MSETLCYEIILEFEHEGKSGTVVLPSTMKPRFKTTDTSDPTEDFIFSIINETTVTNNLNDIIDNLSAFPMKPDRARDELIKQALTSGHYKIVAVKTDCDALPDTIFGDPANDNKPYPSVDDTPPPATNQPNNDLANADRKCYFATFTINYSVSTENKEISVTLYSSANPLPNPLDNGPFLTKEQVLTYIQNVAGQSTRDKVSQGFPDGAQFLGVSWNDEFWKLRVGNGACADQNDPDPPPAVDDPETPEDEEEPLVRLETTRPSDIKLINGKPADESDETEYDMILNNAASDKYFDEYIINKIIADFAKKSTNTKKIITRPTTKDKEFLKNINITPKDGDLSVFEIGVVNNWYKPDTGSFEVAYLVNLGSSRVVPPQIVEKIPTAINISLSLDINLQFSGQIVVWDASPNFIAYTKSDGDDIDTDEDGNSVTITLEKFNPDNKEEKGEDFESCSGVIQYETMTDLDYNIKNVINNSTTVKTITANVNITTGPFVIEIPRSSIRTNVIYRDAVSGNIKYRVIYTKGSLIKIIQDQFAIAIKNNKNKIFNAINQKYSLDPEKDSDFLNKAVDGYRGILLQKAIKSVPKDKHKCAILNHEFATIFLELIFWSHTSMNLIDPENNKILK